MSLSSDATEPAAGRSRGRWLLLAAGAAVVVLILYYAGGALWTHSIDDDPAFGQASEPPEGASRTVAVMADLIEREVDTHGWVANDPFFQPGAILDNMPNYQEGIIDALSRVAFEFRDQIARARGSSEADPDIARVAGNLGFPGDVWLFDFRTSWAPQRSSDSFYRQAMNDLRRYNARLAADEATFEVRADNLQAALDRVAKAVGSASATLYDHSENEAGRIVDFAADDIYYRTKGQLYGYFVLLRALGQDFASVIEERQLRSNWDDMLASFRDAATLAPWIIISGGPDSQFQPAHLASQGFYLLRARVQLSEVSDILLR